MAKIKFLSAAWKNLVMINYEVDSTILKPYLPPILNSTYGWANAW